MSNSNLIVAKEIIKLLKEKALISADENSLENKLASGTVKDTEWKVVFEQQIKNLEDSADKK